MDDSNRMLTGAELITDIDRCEVPYGRCSAWWLGQHSFVVKLGKRVLYLDPFFSDLPARRQASLLAPREVEHADIIFGSHDHADHIDRQVWPTLAQCSERARFVVPELLLDELQRSLSIPEGRWVGLDDETTASIGDLRLTGIAAAHELLDLHPVTGRCPCLGLVVEGNGVVLYHAGDTCIYEGLQTKLKRYGPDIMLLPINGRDAERLARNCIGNMTYQEAADLAGALAPKVTIPAHFDMFPGNMEDPELFVDYMQVKYPHLHTVVPAYGQRMILDAGSP